MPTNRADLSVAQSEAQPATSGPHARAERQPGGRWRWLALTLLLPVAIVIGNFVIGVLTPITSDPQDDMMSFDLVWRYVQGQHLGTDFHSPLGFGPFQAASVLWRLLGPHCYLLRVSADLFALVIVLCSCIVATRQLRRAPGLAALFCITVAFETSGPSIYGYVHNFGMSLFYDRLLMAALSVLFVQAFVNDLNSRRELDYIDHFVAAFLLNILFLVKISGLVLGLAIVVGGHAFRRRVRFWRSLVDISLVLLFVAILLAVDFVITGTSFSPVIRDYGLAAQAMTGSRSIRDALRYALLMPVFAAVALMVLYAISGSENDKGGSLWRCLFIIAFFWACQVALNMSNSAPAALVLLAPAAVVAVVTWTDTPETAIFWRHLWRRLDPRRLDNISIREAIPLLLIAIVLVPDAFSSLIAIKHDYSILAGTAKPITVSANKGITFEVLSVETIHNRLALSINRAIRAIEGLGAGRETIANLDFMNPFPALLLSPSPKGVLVVWNFGVNVPTGYKPAWQEIVGNACIVTEPKQGILDGYCSEPLINAVQPHLASAFTLVYQDDMWKIWKFNGGCDATGRANPVVAGNTQ